MSTSPSSYSPRAALELLVDHGVAFVVVGGVAAGLHGSPMVTYDLDVCYRRDPDNLERLAIALTSINARLRGVDDDVPFLLDAETLEKGDSFTFTTDLGPLDILGTPAGTQGYDDLVLAALEMDVGGFTVLVTSIPDLIAMKRAAGRPKDREAIENLEALRDEIEGLPEL